MTYSLDIVQQRLTSAQFTASNPVPEAAQLCIETDTDRAKVGDGVTAWAGLSYISLSAEQRRSADDVWASMGLSDDRDETGGGGDGGEVGIVSIITVNGDGTVTTDNDGDLIDVITGASDATITLPAPNTANNMTVTIRKADSDAGQVITSPETATLRVVGDNMQLVSNGSDWIVVNGESGTDLRTGAVIAFDEPAVYNTPASPSSATVSYDLSGAIPGTEVVAYFNHGAEPTWPSGSYRVGVWNSGALNVVRFIYLDSSNVVVEVNSNNITANQGHFQAIRKTANTTRNSTTSLTADPDLVVPMLANKTYTLKGSFWFTSNAAPDFKYRFGATGSAAAIYGTITHNTNGTSSPANGVITAYHSSDQVFLGAGNFTGYATFEIRIVNGASDATFQLSWAQNTSDATNTTVHVGSYIEYMQAN